jgi:hypothetical protein
MVVSRRSFMKRGSLLVLTAGVSLGFADRIYGRDADQYRSPTQDNLPQTDDTPAPFNYAKATFLPYVDTIFRVYYPNSSKALTTTLISISDIGPTPDRTEAGRECFVLKFRGTETLRQNTYLVEHAALGRFDLFLGPAGKNKQGVYYEAVINRLNA